jgi:hypothetical protein
VKVSPRPNLENLKTRYGKSYKKIVKTYWEKILPPDWNEIKTEFTKRFEKQALVASFTEDQLRGSLNTDLGMIVKVFNPFSKTWSLRTEYQTLALQKRMTHVEPHVPQIRIDRATGTARKHLKKIRKMEKKKQRQGVKRKREATKKLDFESESLSNSMETDSIEY